MSLIVRIAGPVRRAVKADLETVLARPRPLGDCMSEDNQAELRWRKSTRSAVDNCVLVARTHSHVYVRDSKIADGPILAFEAPAWKSFLEEVRSERYSWTEHSRRE